MTSTVLVNQDAHAVIYGTGGRIVNFVWSGGSRFTTGQMLSWVGSCSFTKCFNSLHIEICELGRIW